MFATERSLKATVTIERDPKLVRDLLIDRGETLQYDDMMGKLYLLKQQLDHAELRWCKYKGVWPTQPRDFVALSGCMSLSEARKWEFLKEGACTDDEDGSFVIASTAAEELLPLLTEENATEEELCGREALRESDEKCKCVRGNLLVSGFLVKKVPEGTELTMIAHSELNGSLPAALINRFAAGEPANIVGRIRSMCLERPSSEQC